MLDFEKDIENYCVGKGQRGSIRTSAAHGRKILFIIIISFDRYETEHSQRDLSGAVSVVSVKKTQSRT